MQSSAQEAPVDLPFTKENELLDLGNSVPGQPCIPLDDGAAVSEFLLKDLSTVRLKSIYRRLFLVSNRENISPLHHQRIKGREVLITERPDLHLVWFYERIYIKPVPPFLFSHGFWTMYLRPTKEQAGTQLALEAYGLLRTYTRLIVHESDFRMAKDLHLVPSTISWEKWCRFAQGFRLLKDRHVAPRYHYGEIRLTRLNFLHTMWYGRNYHQIYHNYATFFSRFGGPLLFTFGGVTVLLTALQTGLAADPENARYQRLSAYIVSLSLVLTLVSLCLLPTLYIFFMMRELFVFIFWYRKLT